MDVQASCAGEKAGTETQHEDQPGKPEGMVSILQ